MPPRLVDDVHLARTNALVGLSDELAIVVGPAAAGIAIALFDFRGAFVFDAITYGVGLLVLPMVHLRARRQEAGEDENPVRWRDALEGWRLVARRPVLRRTILCTGTVFLLYGVSLLSEPLYVRDTLERSETVFASLQTAFGVCLVGGGLVAARLGDRLASFRFVGFGVAGSGLAAIVYLGTPWVHVAFLGVAVWGVFTAAISGPARTVLQRSTPERAHGRVMAADMLASNAAMLVGTVVAGPVIDAIGVPSTVTIAGVLVSSVGLAALAADRRSPADVVALGARGDGPPRVEHEVPQHPRADHAQLDQHGRVAVEVGHREHAASTPGEHRLLLDEPVDQHREDLA
jgi:predicted MFS family arabinose efflux permease